MTLSNKKCKGCGAVLTLEPNAIGFVPKLDQDTKWCYRCFQLKHYNKIVNTGNEKKQIAENLNSMNFKNSVCFLITDISDLSNSLITLPYASDALVVVVNKMDLLPEGQNFEILRDQVFANINETDLNPDQVVFTSIRSKTSLKKLEDLILSYHSKRFKIIFAGQSNVGKSSLINAMLEAKKLPNLLITNAQLNTTINFHKIKFKDFSVIDTPGFIKNDSILSYVDAKHVKKIINTETFKPLIYQIGVPKTIQIENLVRIDAYPSDETSSVVLYINPELQIISSKHKPEMNWNYQGMIQYLDYEKLDTFIFDNLPTKGNFYISGLGIIATKNLAKIEITVHQNINVNQLKAPIL